MPLALPRQISKLVTHGPDRAGALAGMRSALDSYVIRGVQHNAPLLRSVLDVPQFVEGNVSTAFLAEHYPTPEASAPERLPLSERQRDQLLALAAMLWVGREQRLSGGNPLEVRVRAVEWWVGVDGVCWYRRPCRPGGVESQLSARASSGQ